MKNLLAVLLLVCNMAYAGVPVLMYHRVTDGESTDLNVTSAKFKEHLDAIHNAGYHTVKIETLTEAMNGKISLPEKTVAITFDDGWADCLFAAQELQKRKMHATFYIISGAFDDPQYLNAKQVKDMARSMYFEIGAHSHTHFMSFISDLTKLDLNTMAGEMALSKTLIERVIDKPVTSFAWPFGYHTPQSIAMAKKIGFTSTVLVSTRNANERNDALAIDRLNADGRCSGDEIVKSLQTGKPCR